MDFSSPAMIRLRSLLRRSGVFPPLVRAFRKVSGAGYEDGFDAALLSAVGPGDIVWDIGANVGFYTEKFAQRVGSTGHVVAFEPSPRNTAVLRRRITGSDRVTLFPIAMAEHPGKAAFYLNREDTGGTDSLVQHFPDGVAEQVEVCRGDDFLDRFPPSVIKIDVEGFELEVLRGMPQVLRSAGLRKVLIEVHFDILRGRGMPNAPAEITATLRNSNLSVSWVDPSHLVAEHAASERASEQAIRQ